MLDALARNWSWLVFRSVLAAAYGMATFAWPGITIAVLVW